MIIYLLKILNIAARIKGENSNQVKDNKPFCSSSEPGFNYWITKSQGGSFEHVTFQVFKIPFNAHLCDFQAKPLVLH